MKSVNSLLLCIVYALYLVFGGIIFKYMEYDVVENSHISEPPEWTHLKDLALKENPPTDEEQLLIFAPWLYRACPALSQRTISALVTRGSQAQAVWEVEAACPHLHYENVTQEVHYFWSFIDALYFSMTVITTIGYGYHSPRNSWSRIVCILYSLVGIPLTGILLAWTSNFFGDKLLQLFKSRLSDEKQHSHTFIAAATAIYIGAGFLVFIFLPAGVFTYLEEDWDYLDAVYYSYITLTTIGFGDLVTGNGYDGTEKYVYHIGVITWIMVGLGYWVMVANFITKALKSKQLKTSMKRSAEEMKKLMQQFSQKNHDPTFLRQHSKATVNLMLQLSNVLAIQEVNSGEDNKCDFPGTPSTSTTGPSSPSTMTPPVSPMGIPGIASLFGAGLSNNTPLSNLMGPLRKEDHGEKKYTEEYTSVTVSYKS